MMVSDRNVGNNRNFESYLSSDQKTEEAELFVSVPPSLPPLNRRCVGGLSQPYRGVGVEAPRYEDEPTGQVWAVWVVFGIAAVIALPGAVALLSTGEWWIGLGVAPIAGLFLVGLVRSLRAEQKEKQRRQAKGLRNLRD